MEHKSELPRIREIIAKGLPLSEIKAGEFKRIVRALKSNAFIEKDCPDGYFIDWRGECIIFEHFEIDAAKKSKKGSAARNKWAEFGRAVYNEIKEAGDICEFDATTADGESIEFLVECFKDNYLKHFNNIELYKCNIQKRHPDIKGFKVCFVVEQMFSFELSTYRENEPHKFNYIPVQAITEVNDILKQNPVDYILNITHFPITDGQEGVKEVRLKDGRQAFTMGGGNEWEFKPKISFQTYQNAVDFKQSKSIEQIKNEASFMRGSLYYVVEAHTNDETNNSKK